MAAPRPPSLPSPEVRDLLWAVFTPQKRAANLTGQGSFSPAGGLVMKALLAPAVHSGSKARPFSTANDVLAPVLCAPYRGEGRVLVCTCASRSPVLPGTRVAGTRGRVVLEGKFAHPLQLLALPSKEAGQTGSRQSGLPVLSHIRSGSPLQTLQLHLAFLSRKQSVMRGWPGHCEPTLFFNKHLARAACARCSVLRIKEKEKSMYPATGQIHLRENGGEVTLKMHF